MYSSKLLNQCILAVALVGLTPVVALAGDANSTSTKHVAADHKKMEELKHEMEKLKDEMEKFKSEMKKEMKKIHEEHEKLEKHGKSEKED